MPANANSFPSVDPANKTPCHLFSFNLFNASKLVGKSAGDVQAISGTVESQSRIMLFAGKPEGLVSVPSKMSRAEASTGGKDMISLNGPERQKTGYGWYLVREWDVTCAIPPGTEANLCSDCPEPRSRVKGRQWGDEGRGWRYESRRWGDGRR